MAPVATPAAQQKAHLSSQDIMGLEAEYSACVNYGSVAYGRMS